MSELNIVSDMKENVVFKIKNPEDRLSWFKI